MPFATLTTSLEPRQARLMVLASASLAGVLGFVAVMDGAPDGAAVAPAPLTLLLLAAITGAAGLLGVFAARFRTQALASGAELSALQADHVALLRRLDISETVGSPAAETFVYWDESREPRLHTAGIDPRHGVPSSATAIVSAGWLDPAQAQDFRAHVDRLIRDGRPFAMTAATLGGGAMQISGAVRGAYAILRIADISAERKAIRDMEERSQRVARDAALTRALYEALPVPVWFRSADGRIDWVNSAYVRAVDGFSREDVRGRQVELLETRQRTSVSASLTAGRIHRERVHVFVGGERRSYDLVAVPMDGASALIANDAAALETAQGELSRQMAAYDRTLDRVATAVANFGPDQRLAYCNEAYRQLWKLDAEFLKSRPKDGEVLDRLRERRQLPEEADYRKWKTALLGSYTSQASQEAWWYLPSGRTVHVTIEQRPDGGVAYLYDDVTEKLALERRYHAAMNIQRGTLDTLREGVAVFATDGRLSLFNPSFARLWKLNPNDLAREPHVDEVVRRCSVLYSDDAAWANIKRAVTTISGQRQRLQGLMERPDQSVIAYAGLPLPDGAMLLTFVDTTDTTRAERMLRERNDALIQADRLKSQFISLVSYELRSPLQNIIGFSEFLENPKVGPLNPKQREYLQDIHGSSRTLLSIINDILDLTTIDAGALELKRAPVKVAHVVASAAAAVEERMARERITLRETIDPSAFEFMADEHRVKQVLYNLLSNAIGFSKEGDTVVLECRREGDSISFSVTDQGIGIPLEDQPKVFERFVSRAQGSRHRGAGLGLPIVKHLVELHGGAVALRSEPGKGTRVTVRFPVGAKGLMAAE